MYHSWRLTRMENTKKNIFPMFTLSMMLYCISYATVRNYATLFLQNEGFTNAEIGIFYSLGSAFSIISQVFLGTLLDKQDRITAKHMLCAVTGLGILDAALVYFAQARWLIFWGFVVTNMIILLDKSLYNNFGMSYINAGYKLNYSLSRGIGSFSTSFFTILTGVIISKYSTRYIFIFFILMHTLLLLVLLRLPLVRRSDIVDNEGPDTADEDSPNTAPAGSSSHGTPHGTVALTNVNLWLLFVSILLIYSCYNAGNNYHINIIQALGGGSKELGVSDAIMAVVELPAMAAFLPLSRKFSYRRIMCFSLACFVIKVLLFAIATQIYQIYVAQVLQLFSYGLFIPSSAYYINDILGEHRRGRGQALLGVFTSGLSGLLTSPFVGLILDHYPVKTMLLFVGSIASFAVLGAIYSTGRIARVTGVHKTA